MHGPQWECPSGNVQERQIEDDIKRLGTYTSAADIARQMKISDRLANAMAMTDLTNALDRGNQWVPPDKAKQGFTGGGTTVEGERMTIGDAVRRSGLTREMLNVRSSVISQGQASVDPSAIYEWQEMVAEETQRRDPPSDAALEMVLDEFQVYQPGQRASLREQYRQMSVRQQWEIWEQREDMGRLYRRQMDAEKSEDRRRMYEAARQYRGGAVGAPQATKPATPPPAVATGPRRYFDE